MSHVASIETQIFDLAALASCCAEMGLTFKEGQRKYAWFGIHMGDYPLPKGMKAEDLGNCQHAIGVPTTKWEIGLVLDPATGGYSLLFDFFGPQGAPIVAAIGKKGEKLLQRYGVVKATMEAEKKGYAAARSEKEDGSIELLLTKTV